ncbi:substrate-binding domain-containing protein [Domibacillus epiphyticus]|uniref:Sugar ABC transporter substrate-binding protein n=1 Tax=Domibacillus epiphyticus TaxID=1714355 RepID=A0A1V2A7K9_9BACI|nr:substrate-binding domain-containing protein [Domibacillus epiphyticus]OMP66985.1 sugar ABC transporter substrate-binding protein [Domibacillus epiphyticus]
MKRKSSLFTAMLLSGSLVLAACGGQSGSTEKESANKPVEVPDTGSLTINPKIEDKEILGKGPFGEAAVSAKTLELTEDDISKIKKGNFTAALVMHYSGTDYMTAQTDALKASFKRMGIEVIAVTDAQFKAEKQVSDIETVTAKNPDVIVSVPVDPVSTAGAYKKAAEAGIKLVFMDGTAQGLKPGKDFVSIVSGDNYGNGVEAAEVMAKELDGKGKIGVVFHDADFFVTKQRQTAFEETIKKKYPDIEIVAHGGITSPNDGEKVASAMLTKHRDLDGIFAIWDVPGEGVVSAARTAGRDDLVITTTDLGTNVGLEMASGGTVKGLGAQLPYDQGIAEAILAGYALLGKEAPSYVTTPAVQVTKDNLEDSWELVYRQEVPDLIQSAIK